MEENRSNFFCGFRRLGTLSGQPRHKQHCLSRRRKQQQQLVLLASTLFALCYGVCGYSVCGFSATPAFHVGATEVGGGGLGLRGRGGSRYSLTGAWVKSAGAQAGAGAGGGVQGSLCLTGLRGGALGVALAGGIDSRDDGPQGGGPAAEQSHVTSTGLGPESVSSIELSPEKAPLWNVPNVLSLLRLASIPVFATVFYMDIPSRNVVAATIFALAAITDYVDGWWARKYNIVSAFGAFLDPVADKLMVSTALILLAERLGIWMTACTAIIIAREIGISALREWMAQIGKRGNVKVGMAGKVKTAFTMVSITGLLLLMPGCDNTIIPKSCFAATKYLLVGSTVLTVTSGSGYLKAAWPALMGKDD